MLMANNPVAVFENGIGDSVLALPALRALADLFSGRLRLLCNQEMGSMLYWNLPLKERLPLETVRVNGRREFDASETARSIGSCDLIISLLPWHSESVVSLLRLLDVRDTIGFFPDFAHVLPLDHGKHSSDLAFDVVRLLQGSLRIEDYSAPPQYPPACERRVANILASMPAGTRTLFIHGDSLAEKCWPAERFRRVVDRFLDEHPEYMVFDVGWESTLDLSRHSHQIIAAPRLRLDLACAMVAAGDLFLGIDSCFLHVADFARVPGVGIFGPTSPHEFGFRFAAHRHIRGSNGIKDVGEDEVFKAIDTLSRGVKATVTRRRI